MMKERNGSALDKSSSSTTEGNDEGVTKSRDEEQDDVAEPDAPTAVKENAGMSTVLSGEPSVGVQNDDSDV